MKKRINFLYLLKKKKKRKEKNNFYAKKFMSLSVFLKIIFRHKKIFFLLIIT